MHLKRWITGLVALPFLVYLIYSGGAFFAAFIAVVSVIALWEYFNIAFTVPDPSDRARSTVGLSFLCSPYLTAPAIVWTAHKFSVDLVVCILALNLIVCALFSFTRFKSDKGVIETIVKAGQALIYIPLMLAFAVLIRDGSDGMRLAFFHSGDRVRRRYRRALCGNLPGATTSCARRSARERPSKGLSGGLPETWRWAP